MIDIILLYVMSFLVAATIEMWWFTTSLPVHLTKALRKLGWQKHNTKFWPDELDYKYWTRSEWEVWLTSRYDHIPALIQDGLTCPGCFSTHASYIAAILVSAAAPFTCLGKMAFVLGGTVLLPWAVVVSLELLRALRRSSRALRQATPTEEAP